MSRKITKLKLAYADGKIPNYIYPKEYDEHKRFILGHKGESPLVVIGMNPSAAREEYSDRTVNKVIRISELRKHDGWFMLNIYPERSTEQKDLDEYDDVLSKENCEVIIHFLKNNGIKEVWGAWGDLKHPTLLQAKKMLLKKLRENNISIYYFGTLTKAKNPRHPLYMNRKLFVDNSNKHIYK